ncbi:hypothetical protein BCF11_0865 [Collimonas sp. PA-H2]|uniref:hypothetical protein n=1 Tax=Collimonas sp. PA-H2 TaxID=1881062 RepID=UPI000BF4C155|nr:hypothetical protein [Collimonas sp. PA-H2]PFH08510.1 hypothetical protein BCF11_0865 [Collimonas sp. PA-H2]
MTEPVKTVIFYVNFDVDQISAKLDWSTSGGSKPPTGPHSGSVFFNQGDQVGIVVTGGGSLIQNPEYRPPLKSFEITDFTIITRPQIVQCGQGLLTTYAPPSLFSDCLTACLRLPLSFDEKTSDKHHYREITQTWTPPAPPAPPFPPLTIGKQNGRWEVSMYITVKIYREGVATPFHRVFYFDPEGEVGTGLMMPD